MNTTAKNSALEQTIANVERAVFAWLERRGVGPRDPDGSVPARPIQSYKPTHDERANQAVAMWNQLADQFTQAESAFNAEVPANARRIVKSLDSFAPGVAEPVEAFLRSASDSAYVRRMSDASGVSMDDIAVTLDDVAITVHELQAQIEYLLRLCKPFAPVFMRFGVTARTKEPLLSCFEWRLMTEAGWDPDDIADLDGSYDRVRNTPDDRADAVQALMKRVERFDRYFRPVLHAAGVPQATAAADSSEVRQAVVHRGR